VKGAAGVFGIHLGLEVGHGGMAAFGVAGSPLYEEAYGEAAEHAQNPDGVGVTHAASVFVGGGVEALMETILDAPVVAGGEQPLGGVHLVGIPTGQPPNGFGLVRPQVAVQLGHLRDMRKAGLLRRRRASVELPAFVAAAVAFLAPGHRRTRRLRGKKPPERRRTGNARFV
jgi:hypothetical protein